MTLVEKSTDKVGDLNGKWSILLRVILVIVPIFISGSIPWFAWATQELFRNQAFRESGERFTQSDGFMLEARIDARFDTLPPMNWQERIKKLEDNQSIIMRNQTKILLELDRVNK